ncbi:YceI family protein [Streptomyces sp. YKOK-I1]
MNLFNRAASRRRPAPPTSPQLPYRTASFSPDGGPGPDPRLAALTGEWMIDPARSRAEIVLSTASVQTGVEQRDAHLTGRDFLDATAHPRMRFVSTAVRLTGADVYRMTGDLTIKGTTGPVELELTYLGHVVDAFGDERVGFDGTTTINRSEWGLTYNQRLAEGGAMVSQKVRLQFDIAALRTIPGD